MAVRRVVIVGGGESGARAALGLRARGFDGQVLLIGDERDVPYERPPLSKTLFDAGQLRAVPVLDRGRADQESIELVTGDRVVELDRAAQCLLTSGGTRIEYDDLVIATGSRARRLDVPGGDSVLPLRTLSDAGAIAAKVRPGGHLAVIGGGLIGLELAAAARRTGCRVTVLEAAPSVLGRAVPGAIAEVLAARHRAEGVDIRCGVVVTGVEPQGRSCLVQHSGGSLVADVAVAGIGAAANTELAHAAGLVVENGIVVDELLRTSDPAVLAAGDCASVPVRMAGGQHRRLESWRAACEQGSAAAATLMGEVTPSWTVPWFWSDQYDLGLQVAGLVDLAQTTVVRHRRDGVDVHLGVDGSGRLVSAAAVAPGTSVARDIRLAEILIGAGACPDLDDLSNPDVSLKSLVSLQLTLPQGARS